MNELRLFYSNNMIGKFSVFIVYVKNRLLNTCDNTYQNNFGYIVQNYYRQAEGMFYVLGVASAFPCNAYYFLFFFHIFFQDSEKLSNYLLNNRKPQNNPEQITVFLKNIKVCGGEMLL